MYMFNVLIKIVLKAPILSDVCCNMTYYVGTTTQKIRLVVMLAALHAEFDCILKYSYIIRRQAGITLPVSYPCDNFKGASFKQY
jgi:hypothetical protein